MSYPARAEGLVNSIIHQNEAGHLWIQYLLLNIVTVSLNSNIPPFEWEHISLPHKILLTVLWATSSLQFLLPHHWHNVCHLNLLSWGQRDDSWKVLNLMSMEDVVKLTTWKRQLYPLSWCLCSWALSRRRWTLSIGKLGLTSEYHLFGPIKDYASDEGVKTAETKWLKEQSTEFYEAGIHALIQRRNVDYIEKWGWDPHRTSFIMMRDTCSCVFNHSCIKEKGITFWFTLIVSSISI